MRGFRKQSAEELYREHAAFMANFLHRIGVPNGEVEDVLQEVFIVAHRKGGYEPGPAKPRSWLCAIAVRLAGAARRARARRHEECNLEAIESRASQTASPSESVEVMQSLERVQKALSALDTEHRAAFVLYELEGEPCTEIAQVLGVPVGTVYSRLHNARRRFAAAYGALLRDDAPRPRSALMEVRRG